MGFVGGLVGGYMEAGELGQKARMKRAEGMSQKNAAYSKASKVERDAEARGEVAAMNMRRMRVNEAKDKATARAADAMSGVNVTSRDGGRERAIDVLYETQAADMQTAASVDSLNAVNEALGYRRAGDLAQFVANAEADQFNRMAKRQRVGAFAGGVAGLAGALAGFSAAGKGEGLMGALQGSRIGSSFAWSMDPNMSKFASQGWEKDMLSMLKGGGK